MQIFYPTESDPFDIGKIVNLTDIVFSKDGYIEYEPICIIITGSDDLKPYLNYDKTGDPLYYARVKAELDHLSYQYEQGWITSRRQVAIHSHDCMSIVQLQECDNDAVAMHVFMRSSNIHNALYADIGFLSEWLLNSKYKDSELSLNITISVPHSFGNSLTKVEQ